MISVVELSFFYLDFVDNKHRGLVESCMDNDQKVQGMMKQPETFSTLPLSDFAGTQCSTNSTEKKNGVSENMFYVTLTGQRHS